VCAFFNSRSLTHGERTVPLSGACRTAAPIVPVLLRWKSVSPPGLAVEGSGERLSVPSSDPATVGTLPSATAGTVPGVTSAARVVVALSRICFVVPAASDERTAGVDALASVGDTVTASAAKAAAADGEVDATEAELMRPLATAQSEAESADEGSGWDVGDAGTTRGPTDEAAATASICARAAATAGNTRGTRRREPGVAEGGGEANTAVGIASEVEAAEEAAEVAEEEAEVGVAEEGAVGSGMAVGGIGSPPQSTSIW